MSDGGICPNGPVRTMFLAIQLMGFLVLRGLALAPASSEVAQFLGLDAGGAEAQTSSELGAHVTSPGRNTFFAKLTVADSVPSESRAALAVIADGSGGFILQPQSQQMAESEQLLAWGTFADSLAELGWSSLSMHTSAAEVASDRAKMYAAGVVEGYLTAARIQEFHHNSRALVEMSAENQQRLPALEKALAGVISRLQGVVNDGDDAGASQFDTQAHLAFLQTWGVRDGYELALGRTQPLGGNKPLSLVDMFILNSDGVIDELLSKYGGSAVGDSLLERKSAHRRILRGGRGGKRPRKQPAGHCTGFVRLTEDKSELYFGHTTWESFSEMTRVWKVYDFPLQGVAAKRISFSSYPGCISSTDDYYLMDSGLAITETTLSIPKEQDYQSNAVVPDFMRIMAANRLAGSSDEWVRSMAASATGTYSSQWMVLDYKKFNPGQDLPGGTFIVLEQAPGISHYEDMSQWLQREGYWASFDRAFFDEVRARTGDTAMESRSIGAAQEAEAEIYSKGRTPRAQIAMQTARGVNSIAAMREEMTRNHGTEEPVDQPSLRLPRFAISARSDLKDSEHNDPDGSPDGGVDAKVTSACLFKNLLAEAISSPSHASLPPFRWTKPDGTEAWPGYPHEGLPDVANFDWVQAGPQDSGGGVFGATESAPVRPLEGDGGCP